MITSPQLEVSGDRVHVTYRLNDGMQEAARRATAIAVEQTIEFPADLIDDGDIRTTIIGQIEAITESSPSQTEVEISYAWETCAAELTQLLNVIYGNISLQPGIKVLSITLPRRAARTFPGPRYGIQGLRERHGVHDRPLICTALKPMGLSAAAFAAMAYQMALGGVDLIKDDHGLSNQVFAPFEERVQRCAEAVRKANQETGQQTAYYPNISAPAHQLLERARFAQQAGAGGLLLAPGLCGWDSINGLRAAHIDLPIMAHPTFHGTYVLHPDSGFTHRLLYGTLTRLSGADSSVFPNYGGRFSFSQEECRTIRSGCREPFCGYPPIVPAPGGGMTLERIPELVDFYGRDVILLVGGDLHRGESITSTSQQFRAAAARAAAAGAAANQ